VCKKPRRITKPVIGRGRGREVHRKNHDEKGEGWGGENKNINRGNLCGGFAEDCLKDAMEGNWFKGVWRACATPPGSRNHNKQTKWWDKVGRGRGGNQEHETSNCPKPQGNGPHPDLLHAGQKSTTIRENRFINKTGDFTSRHE